MVGCAHVRLYIRFQLSAWLTQAARTRDFYSPDNGQKCMKNNIRNPEPLIMILYCVDTHTV